MQGPYTLRAPSLHLRVGRSCCGFNSDGPLNRRLGSCTWYTERFYVCLRRQQGAGLFLLGTDWSLEAEFLGDDVERRASSGIASWTTVIVRIAMSEQEP